MIVNYQFTDAEIKKILKDNIVIIVDTREQRNEHILDYFEKKKIKYEVKKLDAGDYGIKILPCQELNILREFYIPALIEKKNSVDELAQSFKERTRFENEFIRAAAKKNKMFLLVEDAAGYENLVYGRYRSKYEAKAFLASLKAFENRYNFTASFLDKNLSGNFIYYTLLYAAREYLKS